MVEEITIVRSQDKSEIYKNILPQIKGLIAGEDDLIANLANIMGALKTTMDFFWVGCYFVKNDELILGPFQGPVACTRIAKGRGVCGKAWEENETIIVPNVEEFPGHIACSAASKSEIVLPVRGKDGNVRIIIDIDSNQLDDFDEIDKLYLMKIAELIEELL